MQTKIKDKLKINIIFNTIYQIIVLIIPFITSPYISRTLLPVGLGSYSFSFAYVNYFIIFTDFGFNSYGTVKIAKAKASGDKEAYSKVFWELFWIKIILFIINMIIYFGLTLSDFIYSDQYPLNTKFIYALMGLFILGQGLDLTSLFQGLEKFDSLCIRNLIVKLGVLIFIFIFIKNENDYWKYVLIMAGSHLLSSLIMFPVAFKNLDKPTLHLFNPKVYIKELILFGLPNIF